jgi:ArsR family transcriptional regulator, arsenate/arsenite/antimonite-responsive transcriptional repressor
MAYLSKIEDYPTRQVKVAQFAKALSHPARIAIIEHLHQYGECFCGDIVDELPLAQASVSQHLKELKEAGLVEAIEMPPKVKYRIQPENWKIAKDYFCHFFDEN